MNRQQIKGNKNVESGRLAELYQQRPNRKTLKVFPISIYTWMYQTGYRRYDTTKYLNKKVKISKKYDRKIAQHAGNETKVTKLGNKKVSKLTKMDDKLENGNSFMQKGEPIAVYDSALARSTQQKMTKFFIQRAIFMLSLTWRSKKMVSAFQ